MHVQLQIKEQSLMGSDSMPGAEATCGGYQPPQGLWVSVHAADVAEGRRLFDALAQDGQTVMPFEATFWSPEIGRASCRERVCQYVYISVVAVSLKKKNKE